MGRGSTALRLTMGPLLLLFLSAPAQAQLGGGSLTLSGAGGDAVAADYSAAWDDVDTAIGLGVLWGSINPVFDADPAFLQRPDGKVYLVWGAWDGVDHDLFYAIRPPGGAWSVPLRVHPDDLIDDRTPSPALDAGGYLHVAWMKTAGSGGTVVHAVRVGAKWTPQLAVSTGPDARRPSTWIGTGRTYVTYRTPTMRITSEIILYVGSGVSDDIDPTQVDSEERWHEFVQQ